MEFQKFGLYVTEEDEHSADHNRKITYNDGIFYMFDVYGQMQEIRYNKQLEVLGEYNSDPEGSAYLSSDNIASPSDDY